MLDLSHCHNYFNTVAASLAHTTKLKDKRLKVLLISLVSGKYLDSNTKEQILVVFKNKCEGLGFLFFDNSSSSTSSC